MSPLFTLMFLGFELQILPSIGGTIFLVVGTVAAVGYSRSQSQKVWRESAEGWRNENEANKEKAARLADELTNTALMLKDAHAKTDITTVLSVLALQHQEATAVLTRIADESASRNGHIARVLAESNEKVQRQHGETLVVLTKISQDTAQRSGEIIEIVAETLKTVASLKALPGGTK